MAANGVTRSGKKVQSYEDWKKNQESAADNQSNSGSSSSQAVAATTKSGNGIQSYENWKKQRTSASNSSSVINDSYINTFLRAANIFLNRESSNYAGLNYQSATSRQGKDARLKAWNDLNGRANAIKAHLLTNKDSYNQDGYEYLMKVVDAFITDSRNLNDAFDSRYSYFDQFENENDWSWYEKYKGQDSDTLLKTMESMDAGDEKDWLKDFEAQVFHSELPKYDVEAGRRKLESLERLLEAYDHNRRYSTGAFTDARAEEWLKEIDAKFGGRDGIQNALSRETQRVNLAQRAQDYAANQPNYDAVTKQADFSANSAFDPENNDLLYQYVNSDLHTQLQMEQEYGGYGAVVRQFDYNAYDAMNAQELAIYNYFVNAGDNQGATDFLKHIQNDLNQRKAQQTFEDGYRDNEMAEYIFGISAGLDQFRSGIQGMGDLIAGREEVRSPSATQYTSALIREDLADNGWQMPDWMGGGSLGQMGYDAVTTTANMAPSILASTVVGMLNPTAGAVVGRGLMGMSAAGSGYQEMINAGYSTQQARSYGLAVGTAEIVMEQLLGGIGKLGGMELAGKAVGKLPGVNKLVSWASNVDNALFQGIGKLAGAGFNEGLEEGIQEIVSGWLKSEITGEDFYAKPADVLYSGLLGAITGWAFEGPSIFTETASTSSQGKQILNADIPVQRLVELGNTFSMDTAAAQLAGKVTKDSSAYRIGQLFNEIGATMTEQNAADITEALVKKGVDRNIAQANARALAQVVEGGSLTNRQVKALESNEVLAQAVTETLFDRNTTWYQRAMGYQEIWDQYTGQSFTQTAQQSNANNLTAEKQTSPQMAPETAGYAEVASVASLKDRTVRLSDGTQVKTEDARVSEDDAVIIETLADIEEITDEDADTVFKAVRDSVSVLPGQTAQTVALGMGEAFRYGYYGMGRDYMKQNGAFVNDLTSTQRQALYVLGRERRVKDTKLPKAKAPGREAEHGVYYVAPGGKVTDFDKVETAGIRDRAKAGVKAVQVFQKLGIGGDFYFFESYVNKAGQRVYRDTDGAEKKAPQGWYDRSDGSIYIDLNAGDKGEGLTLFTLSHELTHFVEQWSGEKYKVLSDFLVEQYGKDGSVDDRVKLKQEALRQSRGETVSYQEAFSEVIADSMEAMLSDGKVMEKLAELKKKDQGLVEKIRAFFDDAVKKIRKYFEGVEPQSEEGQLVLEMKDQFEQLQQLFTEALNEAGENFQAVEVQKNTTREGGKEVAEGPQFSGRENTAQQKPADIQARDVVTYGDNTVAVRINGSQSGLHKYKKSQWAAVISKQIRDTLQGHAIYAADGDIIRITKRAAGEVSYGSNSTRLREDAKETGDFSKINQKMITAEHAASIISLSTYNSWSANTEDLRDMFKKDGMNARTVNLLIDGAPYTATVVTGLNADPHHINDYGEKFYDIVNIEKQTNPSAYNGTFKKKATPHTIKFADDSPDMLTVAQKQRIVNRKNATYSSGNDVGKTAFATAFERASKQNQDRSGKIPTARELLANALESTLQNDGEREIIQKYKAEIEKFEAEEEKLRELREKIREISFSKGSRDMTELKRLKEEARKSNNRINIYDKQLLRLESMQGVQRIVEREKAKAKASARAHNEKVLEAYRTQMEESQSVKKQRIAVEKQAKRLMQTLSNPTKDAHVPMVLQQPLQKFLDSIDFTSKQSNRGGAATVRDVAYTRALTSVRNAIAGQRKAMEADDDGSGLFTLDVPDDFLEAIDKHIQTISDATEGMDLTTNRVYDMESAELKDLAYLLKVINKAIRSIDKLHMEGAKARVSELATDTMQEMNRRKPVKGDTGNRFMWGNYTPYHAFRRMGKAAQQVFKGLTMGQAKLARTVDSVLKFAGKTYSDKEVADWEKKQHTIKLDSGDTIIMSTAQIMSFWCLSHREQALGHINAGGIRISTLKNGLEELSQKAHHILTQEDINRINGLLTDRQKQVAQELQKYMQTVGGRLINEISMARWDFMAATEEDYFPIKTDDSTRDVKNPDQERSNLWALLNKSFTKATTPNANNALVISSIFDVFADHMSETAEYNAFALPLVDAMKWFNYRERVELGDGKIKDTGVHQSIRNSLGTEAVAYFVNLMTDINSSQKAGRHENAMGKILSRSKVASVGWNLRVAIQQPTAILRASMLLDLGSLVKGTVRIGTKKLVKEMQEYSGIALWKSLGYYDLNVSRSVQEQIKGNTSLLDKFNEAGMWLPGKVDEKTWARIWAATKAQVAKDMKLTGEELLRATADKFEDVVYQTQVADSVLTRSSFMRSKSQAMKEATSFMAEPTLSYNILLSAFQDYESGHTKWDKAKRGIMIGFYGYTLSAIANALMTSFMDAWRDDDEYEKYWEKYRQALLGDEKFTDGNLFSELNPLEKIVYIRDGLSILKGYDVRSGYADIIQTGYDLITNFQKRLEGKGSLTDYGLVYQALQLIGTAGGFGLSNLTREVVDIWNHTFGKIYNLKLKRYDLGDKAEIRHAYEGRTLTAEEAIEELVNKGVAETADDAYFMVQEWDHGEGYSRYGAVYEATRSGIGFDSAMQELLDHGYTEKQVRSSVRSEAKDWYVGTEDESPSIDRKKALQILTEYAGVSAEDAEATLKKWDFEKEHKFSYDDVKQKFLDEEITAEEATRYQIDIGGYEPEEAQDTVLKWQCQRDTGIEYSAIEEAYRNKDITAEKAVDLQVTYGGVNEAKARKNVEIYDWRETGWEGAEEMDTDGLKAWYDKGVNTGIDKQTFTYWYAIKKGTKSIDADGDGEGDAYSISNQVAERVARMDISRKEKDAIILSFWAKSTLRRYHSKYGSDW